MAKITEKDFIKNGYKKFKDQKFMNKFASFLLQKRILDLEGKTKYFIDVWFYDNDYEIEITFEKAHYVMRILLYCIDDNHYDLIELLEKEIDRIWEKMGKPYYGGER